MKSLDRPVCAACALEMVCARNGFAVQLGSRVWNGDRYECPGCGASVVVGFGLAIEDPDPWEQSSALQVGEAS